ncbi:CHAT domain-containing protein [Desulfobacterales bacterium HSG16]|nr:CHAT domain-containing protein [Desulfobacterales bacterium HSG16]
MKPCITAKLLFWLWIFSSVTAYGQISLDGSMGTAGPLSGPEYEIGAEYGKTAGTNLFHSFDTFSIHNNEKVVFTGPDTIENVISRITGGQSSWIDGSLGLTIPEADLYLMNPAGIMFGPNASLDISGSFHAATADYLEMDGSTDFFYAVFQQNEILSSAHPSAFGFIDDSPASITVEGDSLGGLKVKEGKTISLIAETIIIKNKITDSSPDQAEAILHAPSGKIDIRAVTGPGKVFLDDPDSDTVQHTGNITLSDMVIVDVSGSAGGNTVIRGEKFFMDNSTLSSDTLEDGTGGIIDIRVKSLALENGSTLSADTYDIGNGSDIFISASESIKMSGAGGTASNIQANSHYEDEEAGNAGRINIESGTIIFMDGSRIDSESYGTGNGADIHINASESIEFSGLDGYGSSSGIFAAAKGEDYDAGHAGSVFINTKKLSFKDGAWINNTSNGGGSGGNIDINASESVIFSGIGSDGRGSKIFAGGEDEASNAGGNITIETAELTMTDGALIDSSAFGWGDSGNITITATQSAEFSGYDEHGRASGVKSATQGQEEESGNAGDITISAKELSFTHGAWISNSSSGSGDGGKVTVLSTGNVSFSGIDGKGEAGGILSASISTEEAGGNAGNINIEAGSVTFDDGNFITAGSSGEGAGGDVKIEAEIVEFKSGSYINSSAEGLGSGGSIHISGSKSVTFSGHNQSGSGSNISSFSEGEEYSGDAGDIVIDSGNLSFEDGAWIASSTYGTGQGGNVIIKSSGNVSFSGSDKSGAGSISSLSSSEEDEAGTAGAITIHAQNFSFDDGAYIVSSSEGSGLGGNVDITATDGFSLSGTDADGEGSRITASAENEISQDAGNVTIKADTVLLADGAMIDSSAFGWGNGGNITIDAGKSVKFTGTNEAGQGSGLIARTQGTEEDAGNAGKITINTDNMSLEQGAWIGNTSEGGGQGGDVEITVLQSLKFTGNDKNGYASRVYTSAIGEEEFAGNAGDVRLKASDIVFGDGGGVTASTDGPGAGGSITVICDNEIRFSGGNPHGENTDGFGSGVSARSNSVDDEAGAAGSLYIESGSLLLEGGAVITNSTMGQGTGGKVDIRVRDKIDISGDGSAVIAKEPLTSQEEYADGLTDWSGYKSGIYSRTESNEAEAGTAGEIEINSGSINIADSGKISASSAGGGKGGSILVKSKNFSMNNKGSISSASLSTIDGAGRAGTVSIFADDNIHLKNESAITTEAKNAGGGQMTIEAGNRIYLSHSETTTSVRLGAGNGGDINVGADFLILNDADVIARAYEGTGGNIYIKSDHFIRSPDAVVDASSKLGIDGSIYIESPEVDLGSDMSILPSNFLDAGKWMKQPCSARSGETASRLIYNIKAGLGPHPDDMLTSTIPDEFLDYLPASMKKGVSLYKKRKFKQAAAAWNPVLEKMNPDHDDYSGVLFCSADAFHLAGDYPKSMGLFKKALAEAKDMKDSLLKALVFNKAGDFYLSIGIPEHGLGFMEKAEDIAIKLENPALLAEILNDMGCAYSLIFDMEEANAAWEESLSVADYMKAASKSKNIRARVYINMARTALAGETDSSSDAFMNNAFKFLNESSNKSNHKSNYKFKGTSDPANIGWLRLSLARLMIKALDDNKNSSIDNKKMFAGIKNLLDKARKAGQNIDNVFLTVWASGTTGKIYEDANQIEKAGQFMRQAVFTAGTGDYPELLYYWQWQMARIFEKTKNFNQARDLYQKAADTIGPIRSHLLRQFRRLEDPFYDSIRPVYADFAKFLISQAHRQKDEQARQTILFAARDAMESLKTAELQDFYDDECVAAFQNKTDVLNKPPEGTAILYPLVLDDSIEILLILPTGIKQFSVSTDFPQVETAARRFRSQLQSSASDRFKYYSRKLYDWLIGPMDDKNALAGIDTLLIAPDGVLRLIPFATLHDGKQYLAQKYALVIIPAITLTDPGRVTRNNTNILINGLSEARQGFSALPNVTKEIEKIGNIMGGRVLQDKTYTIGNLTKAFKSRNNSIVHMATHGVFGSSAKNTFLLTYDDKLDMDRLERLIDLGRFRKPVELLSLSACQTALGDERAALGLAGIAIKAGVKSAVASLWFVDDESTFLIMSEFYRQLTIPGTSKAKALQKAQTMLIDKPDFTHPAFWAPFLLIGNWL